MLFFRRKDSSVREVGFYRYNGHFLLKGRVMKAYPEIAEAKFMEGYNCAQSVLFAFCDDLGLDADYALKMSCGFGGGMGRNGEVCGAVSGGILVLGLKFGRGKNDARIQTDIAYAKIREFMDCFSAKHGSCRCRDLLGGCDLTTPAGQAYFKDNECFNIVCKRCVRDAAALVANLTEI
jgi:C_GCAxxG_C_C family probable redox protein